MTALHDYRVDTLPQHIGRDFGLTRAVLVDQPLIDRFADCSRDDQWVHVDVDRARATPLGTTIAHGLLTLALTTSAQYELGVFPEDATQVINYGLDKVRFLAPVASGSKIVMRVELTTAEPKGSGRTLIGCRNTAYCEQNLERPVMVADALYLVMA
jgi:acyl dehydratase